MTYYLFHVILNEVKNPTEELKSIYFSLGSWDISLALNMTCFIPYRRRCRHFAYAADAPLLSLSRHFPRFSGGIYPEGGSKICLCEHSEAISREGEGLRMHILLT